MSLMKQEVKTWADAAVQETAELAATFGTRASGKQLLAERLSTLNQKLSNIEKFEKTDLHGIISPPLKQSYKIIDFFSTESSVTHMHLHSDNEMVLAGNAGIDWYRKLGSEWVPERVREAGQSSVPRAVHAIADSSVLAAVGAAHVLQFTKIDMLGSPSWPQVGYIQFGNKNDVEDMHVQPNGRMIAISGENIQTYAIEGRLHFFKNQFEANSLGIPSCIHGMPNGDIFIGDNLGGLYLYREKNGEYQMLSKHYGHNAAVVCLRSLPDGRLISASEDNTLRVWSVQDDRWSLAVIPGSELMHVQVQAFADGRFVSLRDDGKMLLWSEHQDGWHGEEIFTANIIPSCFQFRSDGSIAVAGKFENTETGIVQIYDGEL